MAPYSSWMVTGVEYVYIAECQPSQLAAAAIFYAISCGKEDELTSASSGATSVETAGAVV